GVFRNCTRHRFGPRSIDPGIENSRTVHVFIVTSEKIGDRGPRLAGGVEEKLAASRSWPIHHCAAMDRISTARIRKWSRWTVNYYSHQSRHGIRNRHA